MKARHILILAAFALTLGVIVVGQAAAKPGPLSTSQIVSQSSTTQAPDLVERYVDRLPASAFYTPAALKAYGLRMQAMARTYERLSTSTAASSDSFDTHDALVGVAGGVGITLLAAGLFVAASRSRRPQIAL
ncbi:MAG TPA: hypothetical protein VE757_07630 [Gaiellaceae bacterium]|nr:hypothetical protein [Gaiellaceae bacterium]